jgi:hypothetical protein
VPVDLPCRGHTVGLRVHATTPAAAPPLEKFFHISKYLPLRKLAVATRCPRADRDQRASCAKIIRAVFKRFRRPAVNQVGVVSGVSPLRLNAQATGTKACLLCLWLRIRCRADTSGRNPVSSFTTSSCYSRPVATAQLKCPVCAKYGANLLDDCSHDVRLTHHGSGLTRLTSGGRCPGVHSGAKRALLHVRERATDAGSRLRI